MAYFFIFRHYKLATRMANSVERALPPLDLTGSSSQVAERWRQWKRSYQYYIDGKGITNPSRKTAQLLHLAGMEVQDIYEDIPDPRPLNANEDNEYVVCLRKLDAHFRAEDNVPYERHVFRQLTPTKGETADKFMVRLRKQARHCNFGPTLEENLRDQLIEKLPNVELKKKLLEVVNITLQAAMDKVRKWEASHEQAGQMVMPSQEPGAGTHAVEERPGRGDKGKSVCFNCGKEGHFAQSTNCPARGRKCSKCGKYGHYASCCKGGRNSKPGKQGNNQQRGGRQQRHGKGRQANHVEGHCNESGEDDSFAFTIEEQTCAMSNSSEPVISVKIGGISRDVLIDSGSASNLISKDTLQELKYQGLKIELKPCLKRLYAYGGRELKIEGQFQTEVSVPKAKVVADFIVVESGRCLLGYSSATDLGILRVDLSGTLGTGDCNTVDGTFVGGLKAKYPSVFQGIGKLKDYQLKLHIDPSVAPVVQKMRRVPFSVKDKVTAKVNELLEKDIIEKVEGPTVWVSPVVVAPKPSGDIRLCVDMRRANEAIIRERLPIPTIDEVLESLNGSGVFSKLDLRWGFHQIELDPDSRDITAFATHDGIFRYKRLSFGVNAAPEKYQHIITQSMAGLQGVSNIADDLIVHGRDTEEHDKELNRFLLAYRSTPHSTTGKSPAELLFRRKLTTKMPELVNVEEEELEVSDQAVRDRDNQRKQFNKDYVDKKFHARDRNVKEGDSVLLEKKKENKLSPCYEKEPYQVISRYGDQVVLRSPQGVQYKRSLQHIKSFNMPDPDEQETPQQDAKPRTEPKSFETPPVAEDQVPMAESPPEDVPSTVPTAEPHVRRSGRITSRPKALSDYVLY